MVVLCNRSIPLLPTCAKQGAAVLVRSLPAKNRQRLAHDVMSASATLPAVFDDVVHFVKMTALTGVLSRLSNADFQQTRQP